MRNEITTGIVIIVCILKKRKLTDNKTTYNHLFGIRL